MALLASIASGFAFACDARDPSAAAPSAATGPREPVEIQLWERIADLRPTPRTLRFDSLAPLWYMPSGWYPPRALPSEPGQAPRAGAWTEGPVATLEVPLARAAQLSVTLQARPVQGEAWLPEQRVVAEWNGTELRRFRLRDDREFEFRIPPKLQHAGLNTFTLLMHYFADPSREAEQAGELRRGILVERIEFRGEGVQPLRNAEETRPETIVQRPAATVSYYAELPHAARLRGSVRFGEGEAWGPDAQLALSLVRDGEAPLVPFTVEAQALESAGVLEIDIDLSSYAGEAVGITLATRAKAPEGARDPRASLYWEALRIEGEEARMPEPRAPASALQRTTAADGKNATNARPNVVVVLFDTLRADFTEPYGATTVSTPNMQRLAREGVTFTQATSNAPSTRASTSTLFTGTYPDTHGVSDVDHVLPTQLRTLAEVLSEAGYATIGVSNNPHVSAQSGLDRGFAHFTPLFDSSEERRRREWSDPAVRAAETWKRHIEKPLARAGEQPFFLYLHEIDPHFPYDPLPPYDAKYDFGYRGALANEPQHSGAGEPTHWQVMRLLQAGNRIQGWLRPADLRYLRSRYAGEVSYVDAYLGWLLDELERRALRENTIVVFVSDHGEQFFEHERWTHGGTVYQEDIRVPFLVALPDGASAGLRLDVHAQLADLTPTLLELLEIEAPPQIQARSLARFVRGERTDAPMRFSSAHSDWVLVSRTPGDRAFERQAMIRAGDWKLLRTRHKSPGLRYDRFALYDLARDPEEQVNRWSEAPMRANWLRHEMVMQEERDRKRRPSAEEKPLDDTTRDALRALGYVE